MPNIATPTILENVLEPVQQLYLQIRGRKIFWCGSGDVMLSEDVMISER